jgi:serine/threonine-protein kinase
MVRERRLVWVDRAGKVGVLTGEPRPIDTPRVSPDGNSIAAIIGEVARDVWIFDRERRNWRRVTFEGESYTPVWSPDSSRLLFIQRNQRSIMTVPADGSAAPELFLSFGEFSTGASFQKELAWSRSGNVLAFLLDRPEGPDIFAAPTPEEKPPEPFHPSLNIEEEPDVSPDGRWIAYVSNESGRSEVYVRPYPPSAGKWLISNNGGGEPAWSPTGTELFYREGDRMMVVDVSTKPSFSVSSSRLLFEGRFVPGVGGRNYDISPDGRRFLMIQRVDEAQSSSTSPTLNLILDWHEELRRRVPTGTD